MSSEDFYFKSNCLLVFLILILGRQIKSFNKSFSMIFYQQLTFANDDEEDDNKDGQRRANRRRLWQMQPFFKIEKSLRNILTWKCLRMTLT